MSAVSAAAAVEFHVAPRGADSNPGTAERPFLTLTRARDAVRKIAPTMDSDIVVSIAPGEYRIEKTLEFTETGPAHAGTHRVDPVQARAEIGDVVVLMPMLTSTAAEIERIVGTLAEAIAEVAAADEAGGPPR